jgi:hypothetical protein
MTSSLISVSSIELLKCVIHQKGVIKIVDEEIHSDFQLNNTKSVIVGTGREEVLARIQRIRVSI